MRASTVTLITCSYDADRSACQLLCDSIDKFAPSDVTHQLFVPKRDLKLFANFRSSRRSVEAQEDLLPKSFFNVPLPRPAWRKYFHLPKRNVYLTPYSLPVRGWIAQQIMKISATLRCESEVVAHIDSDNFFIRPFSIETLIPGGKPRFYAGTEGIGLSTHKPWYEAATTLLGANDDDVYSADYIDQFVIWRRSVVEDMVRQIETTVGKKWAQSLAQTRHFSEYVLYGVFVERVLGLEAAGLSKQTHSLALWLGQSDTSRIEPNLLTHHIVCNIQSTLPVDLKDRLLAFELLVKRAAEQDSSA